MRKRKGRSVMLQRDSNLLRVLKNAKNKSDKAKEFKNLESTVQAGCAMKEQVIHMLSKELR